MKKQLLFIVGLFLLTIISCSKEDSSEITISEKEDLVKQTLIEFNNSAVKTGKLDDFTKIISRKSSEKDFTTIQLEVLFQDFLGDQTQEFINLYNILIDLEITPEEFFIIASQFDYLRINLRMSLSKESNSDACSIAAAGDSSSIIRAILTWAYECESESA